MSAVETFSDGVMQLSIEYCGNKYGERAPGASTTTAQGLPPPAPHAVANFERDRTNVDPGPNRPGAVAARAREHGRFCRRVKKLGDVARIV